MSYPTLEETLARRRAPLLAEARSVARDVLAALRAEGIDARLVGSTARGDVHADSDVDVLVLRHGAHSPLAVVALCERVAGGRRAVDVVFADLLNPAALRGMLLDALDESDLRRG